LLVIAAPHCFGRRFEYNIVVMVSVGCGRVEVEGRRSRSMNIAVTDGPRDQVSKTDAEEKFAIQITQ
jgi:hypothetical protein